jgi:integrase
MDFNELYKSIPKKKIENSIVEFESEMDRLFKETQNSLKIMREQPLLVAFLVCLKTSSDFDYQNYAKLLLDKKIIKFTYPNERLITINEITNKDILDGIEAIRCRKDLEIWEREILVKVYMSFFSWNRNITHYPLSDIVDPDKQRTLNRWLDYDMFIKFLTKLDDRCQLVAKLLYFGGSRVMQEVLNLDICHIDFEKRLISYDSILITYPLHVFEDIKSLIRARKIGKVFLGRQNKSINPATIFRNFNEASSKIGCVISPKMLSVNI